MCDLQTGTEFCRWGSPTGVRVLGPVSRSRDPGVWHWEEEPREHLTLKASAAWVPHRARGSRLKDFIGFCGVFLVLLLWRFFVCLLPHCLACEILVPRRPGQPRDWTHNPYGGSKKPWSLDGQGSRQRLHTWRAYGASWELGLRAKAVTPQEPAPHLPRVFEGVLRRHKQTLVVEPRGRLLSVSSPQTAVWALRPGGHPQPLLRPRCGTLQAQQPTGRERSSIHQQTGCLKSSWPRSSL